VISEKIEKSLRDKGEISSRVLEELHQLVQERAPLTYKSRSYSWQYRSSCFAIGITLEEPGRYRLSESTVEKMYFHYISSAKTPILTFSQYMGAVEGITGLKAA
jgi:hypothetical protein